MAETRWNDQAPEGGAGRAGRERAPRPVLTISDLHVHYGESHALQGVSLTLTSGILAVVGRNGMGKTTLCNTIAGLVPARSGSIRFDGRDIAGRPPHEITRLGVGFVPQGRRLWPSLTVDETLRLAVRKRPDHSPWTVERIYATFPRLAERKGNGGSQLSGGEQQMLAISRALLSNPRLLIMDEPTEGLAPVIVDQVRDMLLRLEREEDLSVLVVEQNIGVATSVSEQVAIMVNGRVNRIMDSRALAADRDLQQRLLGVGRHGHDEEPAPVPAADVEETRSRVAAVFRVVRKDGSLGAGAPGGSSDYGAAPVLPNRWALSDAALGRMPGPAEPEGQGEGPGDELFAIPLAERHGRTALVVGTFDTKGPELKFIRDTLRGMGVRTRTVDLSTSGKPSTADVPPQEVASAHPRGANAVFSGDRGRSVEAMAQAFERWILRQRDVGGIISAGGSGGTALATPAMRRLPVGVPKVMISTVASGDTSRYVGHADIMMLYPVVDVQGLNSIMEQVLRNGASALAGMIARQPTAAERAAARRTARPAVGITMFGVTTPCVQMLAKELDADYECLVFHATGVGGRSMEGLVDSGHIAAAVDVTTTEVADMLVGGVFPATADRFGAFIRQPIPYVGSLGACDMVNFGPRDSVPERFRSRNFVVHNPQVTLMRTTRDENATIGRWIGERLNEMRGPVRFLIPEGGVSLLDAPGKPFHDPEADRALFEAVERTVVRTGLRRVERVPAAINDPVFVQALAAALRDVTVPLQRRA